MWEEITPQDRRAEDAYLEGVGQSSIFLLMLGARYGVTDETGYSATHKEANRAKDLDLARLLFERANVPRMERAGKLNDWIDSLYAELSGARFDDATELVVKLDRQLKELASQQENYWIKLGTLVFPGSVYQRSRAGGTEFLIKATLRDSAVRREVSAAGHGSGLTGYSGGREVLLTWSNATHIVRFSSVELRGTATSVEDAEIACTKTGNPARSSMAAYGGVTYNVGGRTFGPADQFRYWADRALYGRATPNDSEAPLVGWVGSESLSLPVLLESTGAKGWLAEGLARLYVVEEASLRFGGYFERLEVGPATATGLRLVGYYSIPGQGREIVELTGRVPLSGSSRDRS
jgi:hypothetical protein